jgi:hypothetical protein
MENKKQLKTACGKIIEETSETRDHLLAHPDVWKFLEEAVSRVSIPEGALRIEEVVDFGKVIGISKLVKTKPVRLDEKISFAKRINRDWPSRVTKDSEGEPCDSVTVEIRLGGKKKEYFLSTAYIGYPCPDEPFCFLDQESEKFRESIDF